MASGCKIVKIEPHLAEPEWAEGTFPTPMGIIKLRYVKKPNGKIESTVGAPKGNQDCQITVEHHLKKSTQP